MTPCCALKHAAGRRTSPYPCQLYGAAERHRPPASVRQEGQCYHLWNTPRGALPGRRADLPQHRDGTVHTGGGVQPVTIPPWGQIAPDRGVCRIKRAPTSGVHLF